MYPLVELYYEKSLEIGYKDKFPWVDQLAEVKNPTLKDCLNDLLLELLHAKNLESCWLGPPEIVDWESVRGFRYSRSRRQPVLYDIHINSFAETFRDWESVSIDTLKRRQIICVGDDDATRKRWSVYKCLYCEVEDGENTYVLSEGKWYRVASDFLEFVNQRFDDLPRYQEELPVFNDETEGSYNRRVAQEQPERFALLDLVKIPMEGSKSSIEFRDLLSRQKEIIHVKRYRSSSSLSHLFAQGLAARGESHWLARTDLFRRLGVAKSRDITDIPAISLLDPTKNLSLWQANHFHHGLLVSAECFLADSGFRSKLNEKLPDEFRHLAPKVRPNASDYKVVYVDRIDQQPAGYKTRSAWTLSSRLTPCPKHSKKIFRPSLRANFIGGTKSESPVTRTNISTNLFSEIEAISSPILISTPFCDISGTRS